MGRSSNAVDRVGDDAIIELFGLAPFFLLFGWLVDEVEEDPISFANLNLTSLINPLSLEKRWRICEVQVQFSTSEQRKHNLSKNCHKSGLTYWPHSLTKHPSQIVTTRCTAEWELRIRCLMLEICHKAIYVFSDHPHCRKLMMMLFVLGHVSKQFAEHHRQCWMKM